MKGMIGTPTQGREGLLICKKCQRILGSVSRQQYLIFKKTRRCLKCFRAAGGWSLINRDRAKQKRNNPTQKPQVASPLSGATGVVFVKSATAPAQGAGGTTLA